MGADCVGVVQTDIKYIGFQLCNGKKTVRANTKKGEGLYTRPYESQSHMCESARGALVMCHFA